MIIFLSAPLLSPIFTEEEFFDILIKGKRLIVYSNSITFLPSGCGKASGLSILLQPSYTGVSLPRTTREFFRRTADILLRRTLWLNT